jgi:leader peptidase (prepilin peptidase) / N-methyltransferase
VIGWIKLGGKCRYCRERISPRYPIVECIMGAIFAFYYVMIFVMQTGPCPPQGAPRMLSIGTDWPIFGLYLFVLAALFAASLIDAERYMIPQEITAVIAAAGFLVHTFIDNPSLPGALSPGPIGGALALGGGLGLVISIALVRLKILPRAFPNGSPMLDVEKEALIAAGGEIPADVPVMTAVEMRLEMLKELLFLMVPFVMAGLFAEIILNMPEVGRAWTKFLMHDFVSGFLGALLGGLIGGFVVWITRILGSLAFGREAMGLGDVDLMFAVGACLGAGAATIAFFLAPFFGILIALYLLLTKTRREMPYGPYLSLASAAVMLCYCPIANYFASGMQGLVSLITGAPQ